jgi:hypothetical protein
LAFRDALFPGEAPRRTWEVLEARLPPRGAGRLMIGPLALAAGPACADELGTALAGLREVGGVLDLDERRLRFPPRLAAPPAVAVPWPAIAAYDALLVGGTGP